MPEKKKVGCFQFLKSAGIFWSKVTIYCQKGHKISQEAADLLAASLGLSRMYRDDLAQLEAGIALYDAFYRWSRDATDEAHDWPTNPAKP